MTESYQMAIRIIGILLYDKNTLTEKDIEEAVDNALLIPYAEPVEREKLYQDAKRMLRHLK